MSAEEQNNRDVFSVGQLSKSEDWDVAQQEQGEETELQWDHLGHDLSEGEPRLGRDEGRGCLQRDQASTEETEQRVGQQ